MDEEIEIKIVEFSNGVKVVNLLSNPILFDEPGSPSVQVPCTDKLLGLKTYKKRLDPENCDGWRIRIDPPPYPKIRLLKAITLPRIDDVEWLIRNIPNDVLVLVGRARAEVYGFPCVTPMISFMESEPVHRIDCFMWGDTGIVTDTGIPSDE
jgi:hypothetical protein